MEQVQAMPVEGVVEEPVTEESPKPKPKRRTMLAPFGTFLANIFFPYRGNGARIRLGVIIFQILVGVWFWYHNPWHIIPKPQAIVHALVDLWTHGRLAYHLLQTLIGFGWTMLYATAFSFLIGYGSTIEFFKPIGWAVSKLRFWGVVSLQFILFVIFGGTMALKVAMAGFFTSVFLTLAVIKIVNGVSREEKDDGWTLSRKMNEWRVLWYVTIRGTFHLFLEAVEQNAAIGFVMLMAIEALIQSQGGAGALMVRNDKYQKLDYVWAVQISIATIGALLDRLVYEFRRQACEYAIEKGENR